MASLCSVVCNILLAVLCASALTGAIREENATQLEVIMHQYDRLFRPSPSLDQNNGTNDKADEMLQTATQVEIGVNVLSLGPVDQVRMEFRVEMQLLMRWIDPRLRRNSASKSVSSQFVEEALVLSRRADSVWLPGVYFPGATVVRRPDRPSRNILLWLWPNGMLQYSQKLDVVFRCRMDVKCFPFDTQTCLVDIGVFDLSSNDQQLSWFKNGVTFENPNAEFNSEFHSPVIETASAESFSAETGLNFSHLTASFSLRRRHTRYILTNYLPSTFIVLTTWSSFAIDHKSPPARVSLSSLCLVAQLTQSLSLESKLPQVSYVTSLGIWHTGCIAFVYLSLLEYMVINLLRIRKLRRRKRQQALAAKRRRGGTLGPAAASEAAAAIVAGAVVHLSSGRKVCWYLTPSRLDLFCLFAYPIAFFLFNVLYWTLAVDWQY